MATPNSNYTTLLATTLKNYSNKIFNNVVTNNSVLRHLQSANNIKVVTGGTSFVHQLLYSQNSSFAARGHLETIPTPVTDPITASEWEIRTVSGSVVLPMLDVAKNSGSREKLLDYADAKRMEAEVTMSEVLGDQVFNTSQGANDLDSIPTIVAEDVTVSSAVGGINQSAQSWWRNVSYDTAVSGFNTSQEGLNAIDTNLNAVTFGTMGPTLIVTTKTIYTLYMLGLSSNARYTSMKSGDSAFKELMYADIPFIFDDNCPSGNLYGLDTKNLKLQVLAQGNFKQTEYAIRTQQLAESAFFYLFSNLTCGSRRTNFVIDSITG